MDSVRESLDARKSQSKSNEKIRKNLQSSNVLLGSQNEMQQLYKSYDAKSDCLSPHHPRKRLLNIQTGALKTEVSPRDEPFDLELLNILNKPKRMPEDTEQGNSIDITILKSQVDQSSPLFQKSRNPQISRPP